MSTDFWKNHKNWLLENHPDDRVELLSTDLEIKGKRDLAIELADLTGEANTPDEEEDIAAKFARENGLTF